jgi:uncharacterized protein YjeT (DUF2065 family)
MILGIVLIIFGIIYFINPNAFRSLNDKWTSVRRNSMLPYQYKRRIRLISIAIILMGVFSIFRDIVLKK